MANVRGLPTTSSDQWIPESYRRVLDWIASSLVAGVQDDGDAPFDAFFGDGDDVKIGDPNDAPGIVSKIASVLIKGFAAGSATPGDHFGFVAQQIGSFKIGATAFPLQSGSANDLPPDDLPIGITGDLRLREVAP